MIPWGRPKAKREPVNVPESSSAEMSERESSRLRDASELTESARWRRYHESNQWGR